jgi:hypothetical protein
MSSQLSHIDLLERECQADSEKIRRTLEGISNLSQLVSEHLHKSASARNRLRLLTFNSVIEASRLGAEADTICAIADRIAEVSIEWSNITEQSGSALHEILDLSKRISDVLATFSQSSSERLIEAQAHATTGLGNLRRAAAFAITQGLKIGAAAETMRSRSAEIGRSSDLLDACFSRIDEVLADIERVKSQIEVEQTKVKQECDAAEVERPLSASYTTQTERDVLKAAIYGAALIVGQQSATGNDVELF